MPSRSGCYKCRSISCEQVCCKIIRLAKGEGGGSNHKASYTNRNTRSVQRMCLKNKGGDITNNSFRCRSSSSNNNKVITKNFSITQFNSAGLGGTCRVTGVGGKVVGQHNVTSKHDQRVERKAKPVGRIPSRVSEMDEWMSVLYLCEKENKGQVSFCR